MGFLNWGWWGRSPPCADIGKRLEGIEAALKKIQASVDAGNTESHNKLIDILGRTNALAGQGRIIVDRLGRIDSKVDQLLAHGAGIHLEGGSIMYVLKDDNPDVGFQINPPTVVDSEGHPVPGAQPTTAGLVSDNPDVVSVVADPGGDVLKGTIHIGGPNPDGTPALCNLTAKFQDAGGTDIGSLGAQFEVTTGDAAQIVGGSLVFEGLTEV